MTGKDSFMPHVAAVVNPRAGQGRTARAWRVIGAALTRELGPIRTHFTQEPAPENARPATALARRALQQNAQLVIVVGGRRTIHEAINGFFDNGALINADAHLAILNTGASGALDQEDAIRRLASGHVRMRGIGAASFAGANEAFYFLHEARIGMKLKGFASLFRKVRFFSTEEAGDASCATLRPDNSGEGFAGAIEDGAGKRGLLLKTLTAYGEDVPVYLDGVEAGALPARFESLGRTIGLRG